MSELKLHPLRSSNGKFENEDYKAWRFPGGELHFVLKLRPRGPLALLITTRLNDEEDFMLLALAVNAAKKWFNSIEVCIPYFPYAQADRRFSNGDCFALQVMCNLLNSLAITRFSIYDPHSDVAPALLRNCTVRDNSEFVKHVWKNIGSSENIVIVSPDAGAYKKIFALVEKIGFKGRVECCNKYRDPEGNLQVHVPDVSFKDKQILIIDDICVGGRTFTELMWAINENGTRHGMYDKAYLAISHGIFSNGFEELAKYFTKVFVTNSRQDFNLAESEAHHQFKNLLSVYNVI